MTTVRQLERSWGAKQYERLFRDLVAYRPERIIGDEIDAGWSTPAAAMGMIWLDEMCQSHVPLYSTMLRAVLAAQQTDGGWGDLPTTALSLRALLCGNGHGEAIERGISFLANLQKPEGIWPKVTLRRMPEDAIISAIVLHQLGEHAAFQSAVQMYDAIAWFERNESTLGPACKTLWTTAARRCGVAAGKLAWAA